MGAIPVAPIFRQIPLVSCVVNKHWNVDMEHIHQGLSVLGKYNCEWADKMFSFIVILVKLNTFNV